MSIRAGRSASCARRMISSDTINVTSSSGQPLLQDDSGQAGCRTAELLHPVHFKKAQPLIEGNGPLVLQRDLHPHDLGRGKTGFNLREDIAADPLPLACGPDIVIDRKSTSLN